MYHFNLRWNVRVYDKSLGNLLEEAIQDLLKRYEKEADGE